MILSRRGLLAGLGGFMVGGAVATATGLGLYRYRQRNRPKKRKRLQVKTARSDSWILTEADREAITAGDQLVSSDQLEILDNIDIPGSGDYSAMRVSGLGDCVAACEADTECEAFTFARSTHPRGRKRQMCWLKGDAPDAEIFVSDSAYVSGLRPDS